MLQFELKTTTLHDYGVHDVLIDILQLWKYRELAPGLQPFYSFPRPDPGWPGKLEDAARAAGVSVTELAFSRSGSGWWFADWMVVLTTAQVASVLAAELTKYEAERKKARARLVRFDVNQSTTCWGPDKEESGPDLVRWRDFWPEIDRCGRADWPQLLRLPKWILKRDALHPREILGIFRQIDEGYDGVGDVGGLVTLALDPDGLYRITDGPADQRTGIGNDPTDDDDQEDSSHRQVVFLSTRAFRPQRSRRRPTGDTGH